MNGVSYNYKLNPCVNIKKVITYLYFNIFFVQWTFIFS
jgi:hypothetical protein